MNRFAVIGHPVAHSLSPVMHAANFAAVGYDGTYEKFDVEPEDVETFVRKKQAEGYLGLNVTVPHKFAVIGLLDRKDESVIRYGSCNTLKFESDGSVSGWNTDVIGFVGTLAAHGFTPAGKRVMVLGCGGAGSALAACAAFEGAALVTVAARRREAVEEAVARLEGLGTAARIEGFDGLGKADDGELFVSARKADLIVNATPVGLKAEDASVLPAGCFRPGQLVLDIIPTRSFPPTAAAARAAGATAVDGLEFLVGQGAKSFELWTDVKADRAAMLGAVRC